MEYITTFENQRTDKSDRPVAELLIADCGQLIFQSKGKDEKKDRKERKKSPAPSSSSDSSRGNPSSLPISIVKFLGLMMVQTYRA